MHYKTCEICGLKAGRINDKKRLFMAKFPLDEDRCKQWVKVVGKEDLVFVPIEKLHSLKHICGKHFKPKDFKKKKTQLKKTAIPSMEIRNPSLKDEILVGFPLHVTNHSDALYQLTKPSRFLVEHNYCNSDLHSGQKRQHSSNESVELSSPPAASEIEDVPEDNSRNVLSEDPGEFSWQKKTDVISCEPEADDFSQDASMYTDNIQIIDSETESDSEGYICNECNDPVKGGRFICTQCVDYDLCAQCAGERAAHRQHYLLRVPPRRPPDEVQKVLQAIRSMLETDGVVIRSGNEDENHQTKEIKSEIKDEVCDDPLGGILIKELQDTQHETLKHTMQHSVDIEDTRKRNKLETPDNSHSPLKSVIKSKLVGATDAVSIPVLSNVKCRGKLPTIIINSSSNTKSLMRSMAPVVTNTISQAQTQILATSPAHQEPIQPKLTLSDTPRQYAAPVRRRMALKICASASSKIKPLQRLKLVRTVPGAATNRPEQTLQLVPINVVKSGSIQKQELVIENRQIYLSKNQSSSEACKDVQLNDRIPPNTSKS